MNHRVGDHVDRREVELKKQRATNAIQNIFKRDNEIFIGIVYRKSYRDSGERRNTVQKIEKNETMQYCQISIEILVLRILEDKLFHLDRA